MDQETEAAPGYEIGSMPDVDAGLLESLREKQVRQVCDAFGVPRLFLTEPGHVMSREKYRKLVEELEK
jgi:hypothetical protein